MVGTAHAKVGFSAAIICSRGSGCRKRSGMSRLAPRSSAPRREHPTRWRGTSARSPSSVVRGRSGRRSRLRTRPSRAGSRSVRRPGARGTRAASSGARQVESAAHRPGADEFALAQRRRRGLGVGLRLADRDRESRRRVDLRLDAAAPADDVDRVTAVALGQVMAPQPPGERPAQGPRKPAATHSGTLRGPPTAPAPRPRRGRRSPRLLPDHGCCRGRGARHSRRRRWRAAPPSGPACGARVAVADPLTALLTCGFASRK